MKSWTQRFKTFRSKCNLQNISTPNKRSDTNGLVTNYNNKLFIWEFLNRIYGERAGEELNLIWLGVKRKGNWIGTIIVTECLLRDVIEGKRKKYEKTMWNPKFKKRGYETNSFNNKMWNIKKRKWRVKSPLLLQSGFHRNDTAVRARNRPVANQNDLN